VDCCLSTNDAVVSESHHGKEARSILTSNNCTCSASPSKSRLDKHFSAVEDDDPGYQLGERSRVALSINASPYSRVPPISLTR
jgi:hypothetical protein